MRQPQALRSCSLSWLALVLVARHRENIVTRLMPSGGESKIGGKKVNAGRRSFAAALRTTQRLDWLQLVRTDSVGPQTFRSLDQSLRRGGRRRWRPRPTLRATRGPSACASRRS